MLCPELVPIWPTAPDAPRAELFGRAAGKCEEYKMTRNVATDASTRQRCLAILQPNPTTPHFRINMNLRRFTDLRSTGLCDSIVLPPTTSCDGGFLANSLKISQTLKKRAAQIEVLLMDVDGTMTDGGVTLLSETEEIALEIKTFDAHDGQGLMLAVTAGLRTGCITGRQSSALLRRAREMNMEFVYMKQPIKMPAYEEIVRKAGVPESSVAYVGDDLPDLPVMRRAGLAVAVGDAVPEVKKAAHYVTKAKAGRGAIRETVELILKSKGIWEAMIDKARA
jgi:3-deoxy-D-manno-octulosonate 8-phosphate phosphatase (KDO 8-P phosphatase)